MSLSFSCFNITKFSVGVSGTKSLAGAIINCECEGLTEGAYVINITLLSLMSAVVTTAVLYYVVLYYIIFAGF